MIRKSLRKVIPYKTASQEIWKLSRVENVEKIDWNEESYENPAVKQEIIEFIKSGKYVYYPDVNTEKLVAQLAKFHNISNKYISVYNGSDTALDDIFNTYIDDGDKVVLNHPEYGNAYVFIEANGGTVSSYINDDIYKFDYVGFDNYIGEINPKLVYLSNPNNPTGKYVDEEFLSGLCVKYPEVIFVVDEAYIQFTNGGGNFNDTLLRQTTELDNLIVLRTFSKLFALAGLRVGYVVSNNTIIKELGIIKKTKNINMLGQVAATAAIRNIDFYDKMSKTIAQERNSFISKMNELRIVKNVYSSHANFVCVEFNIDTSILIDELADNLIFVRDRNAISGMENTIRFTIKPNMTKVIRKLNEVSERGELQ